MKPLEFKPLQKEAWQEINNHPLIRKWVRDDFGSVEINKGWLYLGVEDKGYVAIEPLNHICYSLHIALLPELWGRGKEVGMAAGWWCFNNTICQKLQVIVPEYNRLAIKISRDCGLELEGVMKKSFAKGFKLHDQVIYGITKRSAICQQQQQQ